MEYHLQNAVKKNTQQTIVSLEFKACLKCKSRLGVKTKQNTKIGVK